MKIRKILSLVFINSLILFPGLGHAYFPQHIKVCLNVYDNRSPYSFNVFFKSPDQMDYGTATHKVRNGRVCNSHLYFLGPKKIKLSVKALEQESIVNTLIQADGSCNLFSSFFPSIETSYFDTTHPRETWTINLEQTSVQYQHIYVFKLSCEHKFS